MLQVFHCHAGVLQLDPFHQLLLHLPLDDLGEDGLLHRPDVGLLAGDLDARAAGLFEEQGPLPEVGVLAYGPDDLPADGHLDLALGDDVESVADIALLEHHVALLVLLRHECSRQQVRLLVRQVAEDMHLADDEQLPCVVQSFGRAAGLAARAVLLQRVREGDLAEHGQAAALRAGSPLGAALHGGRGALVLLAEVLVAALEDCAPRDGALGARDGAEDDDDET
mmetsp:Transcript_115332/g.322381  ORF Transcript_115332/g.322381 Transcript_115332/m.322381 type:complete len:224 (+) Transcript_115332:943-1614(+)